MSRQDASKLLDFRTFFRLLLGKIENNKNQSTGSSRFGELELIGAAALAPRVD